jgi:hypothetical protein
MLCLFFLALSLVRAVFFRPAVSYDFTADAFVVCSFCLFSDFFLRRRRCNDYLATYIKSVADTSVSTQ